MKSEVWLVSLDSLARGIVGGERCSMVAIDKGSESTVGKGSCIFDSIDEEGVEDGLEDPSVLVAMLVESWLLSVNTASSSIKVC